MQNIRSAPTTSRTVFLLCNFCGKSVSSALQDDARLRNVSSNVNKVINKTIIKKLVEC